MNCRATVLGCFKRATALLGEKYGVERADAHASARLLLDFLTGERYAHLLIPDRILDETQLGKLNEFLAQLGAGRPLAYILGHRAFYGREFVCGEGALIPRPETELLIEAVLDRHEANAAISIADLGTGTGCIATTLALELPRSNVFATEISPAALKIARQNASELQARVQFLAGDLTDWVQPIRHLAPLDAIVSNPPYIPAGEIANLQREIRDYEPLLALDGGVDGLNPYRQIAGAVGPMLAEGGAVYLELGAGQFEAVRSLFLANGFRIASPRKDLSGHERVLIAEI